MTPPTGRPVPESPDPVLLDSRLLQDVTEDLLMAVGSPHDLARIVATSLVTSNLLGHDSHGVLRVPRYVAAVRDGQVDPAARATFARQRPATGRVDGHWGWGQPAAALATATATELAAATGVAAVTIERCNHVGRLGEHVAAIAGAGMVGVALCNAEAAVAPFGGIERVLGTNPIAMACPTAAGPPVVFDISTAAVAEGKLSVARAAGARIAPGAVIDAAGGQTTDPAAFYDGGALLPFGGHKGYGLSVFVEILGGILSGSGASSSPQYSHGNGTLVIAIDPEAFVERGRFLDEVAFLARRLTASAPAAGDRPQMPGEPESRTKAARLRDGVPMAASIWREIVALGGTLDLDTSTWMVREPLAWPRGA